MHAAGGHREVEVVHGHHPTTATGAELLVQTGRLDDEVSATWHPSSLRQRRRAAPADTPTAGAAGGQSAGVMSRTRPGSGLAG